MSTLRLFYMMISIAFNPLINAQQFLMKFDIFGLVNASVGIRQPHGAWVAELPGVILGVQDR